MVHVDWIVVRGVGDGWGWIAGRDTLAAVVESRVRETGTGWEVVERCEKGAPRSEPTVTRVDDSLIVGRTAERAHSVSHVWTIL